MKRFSLDFAFIELKIDVEIDGSTHTLEKVKAIDAERDKLLIENGWSILRLPANLVKNDVDSAIIQLSNLIFSRGKQV